MITKYEVRFRLYHYNSGRMDNGWENEIRIFNTPEEAFQLLAKIEKAMSTEGDRGAQIVEDLGYYGGFIEEVLGVFKVEITETKL
jgi:hypothetical protein